jgi:CHAT domain-containing protein
MRSVVLIFCILAAAGLGAVAQTPTPTPADSRVEDIQRLYSQGVDLFYKGDAVSLKEAAKFFTAAAVQSHYLGDKAYAARCLLWAGMAYNRVNDSDNAVKYLTSAYDEAPDEEMAIKADAMRNLGLVYNDIGEHGKAYNIFYLEFKLRGKLKDVPGETGALHNLAMVANELGDVENAITVYEQLIEIERKGEDKRGLASSINNLAYVYWKLADFNKAAALYQEAYQIAFDNDLVDIQAANQIGLGDSYKKLGQHQKALEHYDKGLVLARQVDQKIFEGDALYGIGNVYQAVGQKQKAREFYDQALTLQESLKAREQLSLTLAAEMSVWLELGQPRLAILYGKRAVNLYQGIRGGLEILDQSLQRLYLRSKEATYRDLSNILISEGRLPEAQGVLDLLKDQEYEQLTKLRSGESTGTVPYSQAEGDIVTKIESLATLSRRETELEQARDAKGKLTDAEQSELKNILIDIETANRAFRLSLDALGKAETSVTDKIGEIEADKNLQRALGKLRKELDTGVVAIYTVIGTDDAKPDATAKPPARSKFGWAILVTPEGRKAYPIDVTDLEENVQLLRTALRTADYDPRPIAQKLYNAIFRQTSAKQKATLEKDLTDIFGTYKDKTIMWSLDGVLRYVPMSALYDGKNYLVEKYRSSVFTKQSLLLLTEKDSAKWETLGLGVSEKKTVDNLNFIALDGTKRELEDIVREPNEKTGIFEGTRRLNKDFTKDATMELLRDGIYQAVHIASHFSFNPIDQSASFLVIGDGKLTFADIQDKDNLLASVDLLTLSACDTAMASNGKESEGFPFLAQSLGAKTVIASLWKVSDKGTPELMIRFYKLRAENPLMPKGEAFRQAQLSLLNGTAGSGKPGTDDRRSDPISLDDSGIKLPLFTKDPAKPFAHPHYWASFVLIGNWR